MGSSKPPKQEVIDPAYQLALEAQYNRVGQSGPGGSARYGRGANGNTEVQTLLSPQMQQILNQRGGLAMTQSTNQQMNPQLNQLANAILGRIGQRNGLDLSGGNPWELAGQAPQRQTMDWSNPEALPPDRVVIPQQPRRG